MPPRVLHQCKLRIPESLHGRIKRAAQKNGNSANREIINRLVRSFDQQALIDLDEVAQDMKNTWDTWARLYRH